MTKEAKDDFEFEVEGDEPELEVIDDTPDEDKGHSPMPKEIVEELEKDELDEYSEKVKIRLKQMKKVWHDERREKERADRERQEAIDFAKKVTDENKRLKATMAKGEESLVGSYKQSTELELAAARKAYKEAYEAGDSDKQLEAQERLNAAQYRAEQLKNYKPTLQPETSEVEVEKEVVQVPRPDQKTLAWQERNTWYGSDQEMTATALGLHQKLQQQNGVPYVGTDEYWQTIDSTMRRRFPEYFGEAEKPSGKPARDTKPATVVAPASRSTSSKKIVLKQSQLAIAKKLGLTAEQYAREFAKTEQ